MRIAFQPHAALLLFLLFAGLSPHTSADGPEDIYVKVTRVDQARQEVEVAFAVTPKETRIVFEGDGKGLSAGDYVKMRLDGPKAKVGKAELRSRLVIWKF
jgi:hypothetical protein